MPKKILAVLAALLLCLGMASAFTVDAPGSVLVFNSQKEVWITIDNTSSVEKRLNINFFSPANSDLIEVPEKIDSDSQARIILRLFPRDDLIGQTYESTLEIELGNEKIIRKIDVSFKQEGQIIIEPVPPEPGPIAPDFNSITAGFVPLASFGAENALNILLALVAAILLIAFIARFLQRIK